MSILAFGEILWDVYPEKEIIGGAPFNFSAHCVKLGKNTALLTAIGNDELGKKTAKVIEDYNVSADFLRVIDYPTGVCCVTIDQKGIPSYDLKLGMAYDFISVSEKDKTLINENYNVLYYGTLAQRNEISRLTLEDIIASCKFDVVFFDINIRQSYYDRQIIEKGLKACSILKVSEEEADVFKKVGIVNEYCGDKKYLENLCVILSKQYNIQYVLITLGEKGAMVYSKKENKVFYSPIPKGKALSTVGAGDSFSAAFLCSYLKGEDINTCLNKAVLVSDFVVQNYEAIPEYPENLIESLK